MTFQLPPSGSGGVRFSSNGRRLAAAAGGLEFVRIWDAPENHETAFLRGHTDTVRRVTFSADGSRIYSESENEKLVWAVATDSREAGLQPAEDAEQKAGHKPAALILTDAAWEPPEDATQTSPDGRWFVTTEANSVVLVDLEYKNTPDEAAYRKAKARFEPLWHEAQATAAVTAESWYAAVFHYGLLLKHDPDSLPYHAGLKSSSTRLNAKSQADVEALPTMKDATGQNHGN